MNETPRAPGMHLSLPAITRNLDSLAIEESSQGSNPTVEIITLLDRLKTPPSDAIILQTLQSIQSLLSELPTEPLNDDEDDSIFMESFDLDQNPIISTESLDIVQNPIISTLSNLLSHPNENVQLCVLNTLVELAESSSDAAVKMFEQDAFHLIPDATFRVQGAPTALQAVFLRLGQSLRSESEVAPANQGTRNLINLAIDVIRTQPSSDDVSAALIILSNLLQNETHAQTFGTPELFNFLVSMMNESLEDMPESPASTNRLTEVLTTMICVLWNLEFDKDIQNENKTEVIRRLSQSLDHSSEPIRHSALVLIYNIAAESGGAQEIVFRSDILTKLVGLFVPASDWFKEEILKAFRCLVHEPSFLRPLLSFGVVELVFTAVVHQTSPFTHTLFVLCLKTVFDLLHIGGVN
ncbi:hypothetical protein BLNAU_5228 [Blattamonas nauphoetae]|uniref:ARM repeat-containing protein n=1 Tax=Blattamonas nauphoetae TaxID=2049346 RepID=A0ABQ9Y7T2_9EUKA|nr:hypothetical protein BLNAU_5228 [Blattamonas nauphoetae]